MSEERRIELELKFGLDWKFSTDKEGVEWMRYLKHKEVNYIQTVENGYKMQEVGRALAKAEYLRLIGIDEDGSK